MKKNYFLLIFLLLACAMISCTPPEEDVHPKRPSQRSANLKRYVSKAQSIRAQALARSKPLVTSPLLTEHDWTPFLPTKADGRISSLLLAHEQELAGLVRAASAKRMADKAEQLLNDFKKEVVSATYAAQNTEELKEKIASLSEAYTLSLNNLTNEEILAWTLPEKKVLDTSKKMLDDSSKKLYNDILRDYGLLCAQKSVPILNKAGDDSYLVFSSAPTSEDIEKELHRVAQEADSSFNEVVKKYGNPSIHFTQADITALLQQTSTRYAELEKQVEKLYGEQASAQTKKIFETYQLGLNKILEAPSRLSTKQEQLEGLEGQFREQMTALQVRLNNDFERRAIAKRLSLPME